MRHALLSAAISTILLGGAAFSAGCVSSDEAGDFLDQLSDEFDSASDSFRDDDEDFFDELRDFFDD